MDVHAPIQAFLQQQTAITLPGAAPAFADQQYMKAGIIPFVRQPAAFSYLMMKPKAKHPNNPPRFQICKGTRMYLHRGSGWRDMKAGDEGVEGKEPLMLTALREGVEEVGLKLSPILVLHDLGPYTFSSESTGKNKYMWLFTAELASIEHILPAEEVADTTAQRKWMDAAEFAANGREDHIPILRDIDQRLKIYYGA